MGEGQTGDQGVDDQVQQDAQENQETKTEQQDSNETDFVSKSDLERALSDLHKFKKTARELEAEKVQWEREKKEREMRELEQQQEWEKIAKLREEEAKSAMEQYETLKTSLVYQKKYDALKTAALKSGIKEHALRDLELLDFSDDVAIETTSTGRTNVLGVESAIKKLKSERPHWFGKSMGSVNTDLPDQVPGKAITPKDLVKLQNEARQSQDWTKYQSALKQYRSQA